jgi:uncharacterized membrane protein
MLYSNSQSRLTKSLRLILPYFLLVISISGISITIILQRFDLTVLGLILVVPLILAAIILLINRKINNYESDLPKYMSHMQFHHLFLINMLIYIVSIFILITYTTRPLVYFIFMAMYSGVILLQIISQRPKWTDGLIVFEIILLSLNLIWGVTLKYPLYFGDTDTLVHLRLIETILQTSHTETYYLDYIYYPIYHILVAVGSEVTGWSIRTVLFITIGIAWQAGIIFAYLIFKKLTNSRTLGLTGCLLFASSSQVIFYGSYAVARSLAFVFMVCWLYLILGKAKKEIKYLSLSIIIMAAMIMTHHINVMYLIPVLLLVYIFQIFIYRSWTKGIINPLFICLLIISTISYLVFIAFSMSGSVLPIVIKEILRSTGTFDSNPTHGYGFSVLPNMIYYSFVLLLCLLGISIIFSRNKLSHRIKMAGIIGLSGFVLLLVYVPGPVDLLPVSNIMLTSRLPLVVSPFIIFLMVYGVKYIYNVIGTSKIKTAISSYLIVLPVCFVAVMTFFSTISVGNSEDSNSFAYTASSDSPYFANTELKSFSFLNDKADTTLPLYTDYQAMRNDFSLSNFNDRNIIENGDISYIKDGYILFRNNEFEKKKALSFSPDGKGRYIYRYRLDSLNPQQDILINFESKDRVYCNGSVQIFMLASSGS